MKKVLFAITGIVISFIAEAKIWRVNNTVGVTADFSTTTAAFSSASVQNGDTIHIEASASAYQNIVVTKRVTIIGAGYFLTETSPLVANQKTQANANGSYMDYLYFGPGSKGSSVSGITCYQVQLDDSLITVQRCKINGSLTVNINNNIYADTIRQNILDGMSSYNNNTTKAENLIIYNNIFTGYYCLNFYSNCINLNNGYFINNSCIGGASYFNCINFTFQNDILTSPNFFAYLPSNVLFNCISTNSVIPASNSNQQNVDLNTVFVGYNSAAGFSSDGRFQLKTGSPAIGAGVLNSGPVDCGAFGGPAPYVLSGMPSVPSIYAFTAPGTVATGTTTMNITISTIAH